MKNSWLASGQGPALSVMRPVIGFTFMAHGLQKTLGLLGGRVVPALSQAGIAGYLELIGGTLIMLGLFTRPAAFLLSGEMAYAYFSVHARGGFWPIMNRGELAVVYCFVFLYLVFSGGGPWSLDAALRPGHTRRVK
jgi:putative oxidoreductase